MIQRITSAEIIASPLLKAYEEECSIPFLGPTKPDAELYAVLERNGVLHCFGSFAEDEMRGFATVLTTVYPHYSQKVATVESLYGCGDLIRYVEAFAKDAGCAAIMFSAPLGGRLDHLLTAKKSFERTSLIFGKAL